MCSTKPQDQKSVIATNVLRDIGNFPYSVPYISGPDEIDNEDYHNNPKFKMFVSSTGIKNYMISPKYFLFTIMNPDTKSISEEAQVKGNAYHDALASIANSGNYSLFDSKYFLFEEPINEKTGSPYGYTTKAYQEAKQEAILKNSGKTPIMASEVTEIKKMIDQLLYGSRHNSNDIKMLLKNGLAEQSFFCKHSDSFFKFRTDLLTKNKIVDWKSIGSDDLHEQTIRRQISKFGYDVSAAFYQYFYHEITGDWMDFFWVFQQKTPPYDFVIVDSAPWTYSFQKERFGGKVQKMVTEINVGARKFLSMLEQHLICMEENQWDGASILIEPNFLGKRIMQNKPYYEPELIYYL